MFAKETSTYGFNDQLTVTAVLVTYNSVEVIAESLRALGASKQVSSIIVVDNASTDETLNLVRNEFPRVTVIANSQNRGFGRANNQALRQVTTPYALLLNPDAVASPAAVRTMLDVAEDHSEAAIVGPVSQQQDAGVSRCRVGTTWAPKKRRIPPNTDMPVDFLIGAAMLMRMSLIRKIGLFDPRIFLFHEDDDICRAVREAGYSLVLTSKAVISHRVGHSTPRAPDTVAFKKCHFVWSRLYIEEKVCGRGAALKLADRTLRQLARKKLLAQLLFDDFKMSSIAARVYAVRCFVANQVPMTESTDFIKRLARLESNAVDSHAPQSPLVQPVISTAHALGGGL